MVGRNQGIANFTKAQTFVVLEEEALGRTVAVKEGQLRQLEKNTEVIQPWLRDNRFTEYPGTKRWPAFKREMKNCWRLFEKRLVEDPINGARRSGRNSTEKNNASLNNVENIRVIHSIRRTACGGERREDRRAIADPHCTVKAKIPIL
ncbi:hypothetical protein FNV43_RR14496 [Rhamnella rubrinervis]|uniref:Uncharacterized protein n=1 Tax=Rhamnella rubrinervis TaxID=2594499 RepID=A0A8K0MGH2_9ROSA|nr:hypothetical protein FNV43_RR14496 [Rhamnella rubrinervis]